MGAAMLNVHRLRLLREVKLRGTVTAAAQALSYSSSTVSQQIAALERDVGALLLEPVGRRVRLTPQAEILVRHAEAVLERLTEAEVELGESLGKPTGRLRLALFQTAAIALIPEVLTDLERDLPGVSVVISEIDPDDALDALAAYDFDMIVGEEYPGVPTRRAPGIVQERLALDPLRARVPASVQVRPGTDLLPQLADQPWVMEPEGNAARTWATALCRAAGFEPDVRFESADLFFHLRLAETGHAVALLPDLIWATGRPTGPVFDLPDRPERRIFVASQRANRMRPAIDAFRERLRDSIAAHSERLTRTRSFGVSE